MSIRLLELNLRLLLQFLSVEKFKSDLSGIASDAKADKKIQATRLANAVKLEVEKSKGITKQIETEAKAEGSTQEA
jgi:hypothetical protein